MKRWIVIDFGAIHYTEVRYKMLNFTEVNPARIESDTTSDWQLAVI